VIRLEREQRLQYDITHPNPIIQFMNTHPYLTAGLIIALGVGIWAALVLAGRGVR
jgi:hypothetical protein